ncbi:aldolase [bacterium LRH843]|nr:aldolase [bacterium LRH843]
MATNTVKERLAAGEVAIGTMVFEFNTPGIASILDQTGADFIIYDMEHGGIGIESVRQLMSYNRGVDIMPVVRVPDTEYAYMARTLDIGAKGIMIPLVDTKEQAQQIIDATKYYPLGKRGTAFGIAHDQFKPGNVVEKMKASNDNTLIIAQIETIESLENIEEIVSTEGVDVAFIGALDLSQSMGIPGQLDHPRVVEAMEHVAAVCEKYNKAAGTFVLSEEAAVTWIKKGYRCIAYSGDIWLYQNAVSQGISNIKKRIL